MRVQPPSPPCPASITVMHPAFTRRNRGQHPGGVLKRRWRNGKRGGLLSRRSRFDSSAAYARSCSVGVADISPGSQPGECRFDPGTEHARPYRPMARPLAFQAGEDGSEPSRVTAGWGSPVPRLAHNQETAGSNPAPATKARRAPGPERRQSAALSFWCRLMAGPLAVNQLIGVRVPAPERST